MINICKGD